MSTPPPSTQPPGSSIRVEDVPVPPYVVQKATDAYQQGYVLGWKLSAIAFDKIQEVGKELITDPITNKQDVRAARAPAWDEIPADDEFVGLGEWLYKWGFVDGWEASGAAYVREQRKQRGL